MSEVPKRGWRSFERAAWSRLREGTDVLRWPSPRLAQINIFPAFDNAESWELFGEAPNSRTTCKRAIHRLWRADSDYPDLESLDAGDFDEPGFDEQVAEHLPELPTIEERTIPIQSDMINSILTLLASVRLPLVPTQVPEGFDGVLYEAKIGGFSDWIQVGWWCDGPHEWREVTSRIAMLLVQLEKQLAQSQCDGGD